MQNNIIGRVTNALIILIALTSSISPVLANQEMKARSTDCLISGRLSAGSTHCLVLNSDGSITGLGDNSWGIADPPEGNNFVAVSAGDYYSLALTSEGRITGWGNDVFGQVHAPEDENYIMISANNTHSLALTSDGRIIAWGSDRYGLTKPPAGSGYKAIAAGRVCSFALKSNGSIVSWGNKNSDLMNLPNGKDFVAIAVGLAHALALRSDGSLAVWGENVFVKKGMPSGKGFVAIATALNYCMALKSNGTVISWGDYLSEDDIMPSGENCVAIAAGSFHSIALKADGTIVAWGNKSATVKPTIPLLKPKMIRKKLTTLDEHVSEICSVSSFNSIKPTPGSIRLMLNDKMTGFNLVHIKAGAFNMGDSRGHSDKYLAYVAPAIEKIWDTWPERKIKITKDFYIGKYKITCGQFCEFLNAVENPQEYIELNASSRIKLQDGIYLYKDGCADCPVNVVHWAGAFEFCQWLSSKTEFAVRLPTEAEWEYVARGPENRVCPWGNDKDVEWHENPRLDYREYPHPWSCAPVGSFPDNCTLDGVMGMAGIVGEWCSDLYGAKYLKDDLIDPQGPDEEDLPIKISPLVGMIEGKYHVLRGRSKFTTRRDFGDKVDESAGIYGFRIIVEIPSR